MSELAIRTGEWWGPELPTRIQPWDTKRKHQAREFFNEVDHEQQLRRLYKYLESESDPKLSFETDVSAQLKVILELEENWDGDGSPCYTREETERVEQFCLKLYREFTKTFGKGLHKPLISPSESSIDLFWQKGSSGVLINIPNDKSKTCEIFGTRKGADGPTIQSSSDIEEVVLDAAIALGILIK